MWMVRTGVMSLRAYDSERKVWLQVHIQARYVIYRLLREAGVVTVDAKENDFLINIDRSRLHSEGLPAFLLKLNVHKALADYENGSSLFNSYSTVDDEHIKIREIYLQKKRPRETFVQPTLQLANKKVWYVDYDATPKV